MAGSTKIPHSPSSSLDATGEAKLNLGAVHTLTPGCPSTTAPCGAINVVFFGEIGVEKSSVINLIAGRDVSKASDSVKGCMMESTSYNIPFDDINLTVFDTIGLEEPETGTNGCLNAIEKAFKLITILKAAGGIHLLLFCMRAGRITATARNNYRLFYDHLCSRKVPIALVFTGLEREADPEDWWRRYSTDVEHYDIKYRGHACITAVQNGTPEELAKYIESQARIRDLIKNCALKSPASLPESHVWFAKSAKGIMSFIKKRSEPGRKQLLKVLKLHCNLAPDVAKKIVDMIQKSNTEPNEDDIDPVEGEDPRPLNIDGNISEVTINTTTFTTDSIPSSHLYPTFQEPDTGIDHAILKLWRQDQLESAEALLSSTISKSENPSHYALASRSLIRTRLQKWDAAVDDAEQVSSSLLLLPPPLMSIYTKSINTHSSVIGYISKSVALVCRGERDKGYRTCDIAFKHFHSEYVDFILLIKAVIISLAEEHNDAISRVDDLIATTALSDSVCNVVQAYMYFLLGESQMKNSEYQDAIQSFEHAQNRVQHYAGHPPKVISLISGWKFDHIEIMIRRRHCEALLAGPTKEGISSLPKVLDAVKVDIMSDKWLSNFNLRCHAKLPQLGDTAMDEQRYDEAIAYYSAALTLDLGCRKDLFIKRSKAGMAKGLWDEALHDVDEAIRLDLSSPWSYEMKHKILHEAKRYSHAVGAFETMLEKMERSPNPSIRKRHGQYISPSKTRAVIHRIVEQIILRLPRILINTSTGRLQNRAEQESTFESSSLFHELVSSMTTRIDEPRIQTEAKRYFRYVMLSHTWEKDEPLFQHVTKKVVYNLEDSPTHNKLKNFCTIVRDKFKIVWAWSDTCCIDKKDHVVLHEALVAMFQWYRDSAMVIVYLRDVRSPAKPGDLAESKWNTRAWPFQEYVAAKVIQFYSEDWTLYRDLTRNFNHKESPEIIEEMANAAKVPAARLKELRPGLNNIREKLRLASTRKTREVEDKAYSLLGIFSVSGIHPKYGEREDALGRLLVDILSGSGDVSILAWTGRSSRVNSCLPAPIAVYSKPATTHLPHRIEVAATVTKLRSATLDLALAVRLYDRLSGLPKLSFEANRMTLPCIAFKLSLLSHPSQHLSHHAPPIHIYHTETETSPFVAMKVETRWDLSRLRSLYVAHPWLGALLGRKDMYIGTPTDDNIAESSLLGADDEEFDDECVEYDEDDEDDDEDEDSSSSLHEANSPLAPAPVDMISPDKVTRALQLIARLRHPFGALLFKPMLTGGRKVYKRVAADSLITVQIREDVPLRALFDNVRTLDVL